MKMYRMEVKRNLNFLIKPRINIIVAMLSPLDALDVTPQTIYSRTTALSSIFGNTSLSLPSLFPVPNREIEP